MKAALGASFRSARESVLLGAATAAAVAFMLATQLDAQEGPPTGPADTQVKSMPVPASVYQLQAHEVVAQIIGQRHELLLSDAQFDELEKLHQAILDERAIYESTGAKPPYHRRPVWVTTAKQALDRAFTILTPQQQHQSLMLFASTTQQGAATPVVDTSTTNQPVPASVHQLQAHEVVAQIIGQRHELLLSDAQFEELQKLHRAVLGERAIYESTGHKPPYHRRPVWITTPEQALAKAFTILTPQQQHQSLMLFAKAERAP
jgi:dihydrofolate reductase